jgi:CDP-diacylglycerol--glycerol-3-phosphate 3-phosphatidyltransferase
MNTLIDVIRRIVRSFMHRLAVALNKFFRGRLSPNTITITGLLAHIPIAWLIAAQYNFWAAGLLLFFGLFDTLDGELARLQGSSSNAGMLLDATTDRMKEVLLYTGAAYAIVAVGRPYMAFWAVLACGGSLLVSYVKAKGETAVARKLPAAQVNRLFQDGLMRFEVRMAVLFLGLLSGRLILAVIIIAITAWFTAFQRLIKISRSLK